MSWQATAYVSSLITCPNGEGSAIHVMLQSQNHARPSLLFNRLWNGIGSPALHG